MIFTEGTLYVTEHGWDLLTTGLVDFLLCDEDKTAMHEGHVLSAGGTVVVSSIATNRTFITEVLGVLTFADMKSCLEHIPEKCIKKLLSRPPGRDVTPTEARRLLLTDSELYSQGSVNLVRVMIPAGGDPTFLSPVT